MGAVAPLPLDVHRAFALWESCARAKRIRIDGVVESLLGGRHLTLLDAEKAGFAFFFAGADAEWRLKGLCVSLEVSFASFWSRVEAEVFDIAA
eukprot:scaffold18994_cov40-Tisochrysis_lutea.AAC.1